MAWNELGYIYGKMGENQKAIDAFNQAINMDMDYHFAWNNLAWIYNKQGDYVKAIDACLQALRVIPESGETMSHFGYALYKNGDHQRALELIKRSIEIDPENMSARQHLKEICEVLVVNIDSIVHRIELKIKQELDSKKNYRLYHLYKLAKFLYSIKSAEKALKARNLCLEIDSSSKMLLKLRNIIQKFILIQK